MNSVNTNIDTNIDTYKSNLIDSFEFHFQEYYHVNNYYVCKNFIKYMSNLLEIHNKNNINKYLKIKNIESNKIINFTFNNITLILTVSKSNTYTCNKLIANLYLIVKEITQIDVNYEISHKILQKIKQTYKCIFYETNKEIEKINKFVIDIRNLENSQKLQVK